VEGGIVLGGGGDLSVIKTEGHKVEPDTLAGLVRSSVFRVNKGVIEYACFSVSICFLIVSLGLGICKMSNIILKA